MPREQLKNIVEEVCYFLNDRNKEILLVELENQKDLSDRKTVVGFINGYLHTFIDEIVEF
jgi:esterase/lipase superfamily enzyme